MINYIRKRWSMALAALAAFVFCTLPSVAAEGDFTLDTTQAEQAVTEMQTKMTAFLTGPVGKFVLAIVGACFFFLVVKIAWKAANNWGKKAG